MKNLKIWSLALALLVALTGCESKEDAAANTVPFKPVATAQLAEKMVNVWQLVEYAGQPAQFDVVIDFQAEAFELYQRLYSSEYEKLTGTYTLEGDVLTGVYSNEVEWNNAYTVQIAENPLRLRLIEANGAYAEYNAIEEVPAYIKDVAVESAGAAEASRASVYFL